MGAPNAHARKWILVAVALGVLVLGALSLAYFRYLAPALRADSDVRQAIKRIAASGAPVKVTQLAKPRVADAENAALVYEKAFAATRFTEKDRRFAADVASGKSSLSDPSVARRAEAILTNNAESIQLIRRAAAMPRCDFEVDWSKGFEVAFPHLAKLRNCSNLLALESMMLARRGRVDRAIETCRENLHLTKAADEPVVIGVFVQYAIVAITCRSLNAVLREAQPSVSVCRLSAGDMARTDLMTPFITALKGERAAGISLFEQVRTSPDPANEIRELTGEPHKRAPDSGSAGGGSIVRWWFASDELTYLELMDRAIEEAPLPYRKVVNVHPSVEESVEHLPSYPPHILTMILMSAFGHPQKARDGAIARRDLAEVALLLKAYRAEHGGYPQSLQQLGGINDHPLPTDPFSGKPFVYRREGAGFLIYSWGSNLKDDGGKVGKTQDEGDIVMRCGR